MNFSNNKYNKAKYFVIPAKAEISNPESVTMDSRLPHECVRGSDAISFRAIKFSLLALACTSILWHSAPVSSQSKGADVEANELNYLEKESKIIAKGDVKVTYENRKLNANAVTYDQDNNRISAQGNVVLYNNDGTIYYADEADFNEKLTKGTVGNLTGKFPDNSLFSAKKATRHNEDLMVLQSAGYSPCKVCKKKMDGNPLWQISAGEVTFDDANERISYKNATFDIYGVPVLYTPYFSHATPGAGRKSGFLLPTYSSVSTLGVTVKTPYYFNISPNIDATIEPMFTSEEGVVLSGSVRHLTKTGSYQLEGSITNPKQRDEFGLRSSGREIRGHIQGSGKFKISDSVSWGFDGRRASDDTYLQRYKFGNEDLLTSQAYIEKIDGRDYIGARAISFQGLNVNDDPDTTPLVLPLIKAHFERDAGYKNSSWIFDANSLILSRNEGVDSRRISGSVGWKIPHITKNGHIFEATTSLRGDLYSVDNVQTGSGEKDGFIGRLIPEINVNWRYPLAKSLDSTTLFLEPIINLIVSPNGGNPDKIPNEDSQELELSDINLFSRNHFTGLDRVESGARTNYGVRGGINTDLANFNFLVGQNYQANVNGNFTAESGMDDNFSDYIGKLSVQKSNMFNLSYRFRIDKDDFTMRRNEVNANFTVSKANFNLGYVSLNEENEIFDKNEIHASTIIPVNNNWSLSARGRRNLDDSGGWINTAAGIIFENECLRFDTQFGREFTRDRDIEPTTSVMVKISFKNIGNF